MKKKSMYIFLEFGFSFFQVYENVGLKLSNKRSSSAWQFTIVICHFLNP